MKNELVKLNEAIANAIHEFQTTTILQVISVRVSTGRNVAKKSTIRVSCEIRDGIKEERLDEEQLLGITDQKKKSMIVINLEGGCGNQLFMMGFGLAYSQKHNLDYCVYTKVNNPHIYDKGVYNLSAYRFPGINYCDEPPILPVFNEPHFHFADIPKMDNVCFRGFWQSFKYIGKYRNEVLKAFGFDNIETKRGVCSIHYRATDYKDYPDFHPVIKEEYIIEAVSKMKQNGYNKFLVFSDSISEIREIIKSCPFDSRLTFEYSEGRTELEDLREMASCESNITANSTFSAWAAYINPNPDKIVVQPKEWFGSALNHNTVDLYLPNSIIL